MTKNTMRRFFLMTLVTALLLSLSPLSLALAETAPQEAGQPAGEIPAAAEEKTGEEEAPANFFAERKLTDIYGKPFDASVFAGKPVFINIWATWCSPCLMEMPHLDELAREYADKITIVGLHAEGMTVKDGELVPWEEKNEAARAVAEEKGLSFPLLNPDSDLFVIMNFPDYGLQVSSLPTTWLVDGTGSIKSVIPGSRDKATWQEIIDGFLKYLEENEVEKTEG